MIPPLSIKAGTCDSERRSIGRRRSIALIALTGIIATAALVPFYALQLPPVPGFIFASEGISGMAGLLTALLLYSQFFVTRSRALLILASGYFFVVLIAAARVSTFPGIFSPTGLLGAGLQTAPWLYLAWHLGLSIAVAAYAVVKFEGFIGDTLRSSTTNAIWLSLIMVLGLALAVVGGVTAGHDALPHLLIDQTRISSIAGYVAVLPLAAAALAVVLLAKRQGSVLDHWLMVSLCFVIAEVTLATAFVSERFSFGFYLMHTYRVISALVVLAALHAEAVRALAIAARGVPVTKSEEENKPSSLRGATGALAHEVKQPLASIVLNVATVKELLRLRSLDGASEALGEISESARRVSDAVTSFRNACTGDKRDWRSFDANDIVADALRQMDDELETRAIAVEHQRGTNLPKIEGDKAQLIQVVQNLVRHCAEAMEDAARLERVVRIETTRHGADKLLISVGDSGRGLTPKVAGDVFDAFKITKASGMELGLTLSRVIVERHGGEISVSSGMGGPFQILLPVSASTVSAAELPRAAARR